jgi:hypothetical protein
MTLQPAGGKDVIAEIHHERAPHEQEFETEPTGF